MSAPTRSGERGAAATYGRDASRRLAARRPTMPLRDGPEDTDPARRPDTADEARARALWLRDETPGLDESHAIPGHPGYQ